MAGTRILAASQSFLRSTRTAAEGWKSDRSAWLGSNLIGPFNTPLARHNEGMSRERYTYTRTCPKGGRKVDIECTENDHPYMKSFDHRIEKLTEGFFVSQRGDTATQTKITCRGCGAEAK